MAHDKNKVKEAVIAEVESWWSMNELTAETLVNEVLDNPECDPVLTKVFINKLVGSTIYK
ncbi:hypothetical protein [Moorena sp. SIO3A5]|uniref:hypothetical protein n=1 Tax=Moorena sp. SIO3A5 TaxID=2607822 RepID=UPI00258044C4|nr:hypothetical protein [Moorena sp. SIO3A5]